MKFYVCKHCGNIITYLNNAGVPVVCCGEKMSELVPGTTDAAVEKHVPAVSVDGNVVTVKVGEVEHPMVDVHYIQWIVLQTNQGNLIKNLQPNQPPVATFVLADGERAIAAYEYCNLHGLWRKDT
ncbi:MAG: desulfoferrodoxin [Clostridia bacterium]|nr:desulfoferrodoxin [Clostridia bacterium]